MLHKAPEPGSVTSSGLDTVNSALGMECLFGIQDHLWSIEIWVELWSPEGSSLNQREKEPLSSQPLEFKRERERERREQASLICLLACFFCPIWTRNG